MYSLREPDSPVQVISLGEEERSISMSYSRQFAVLTDNAVSFDFGTEVKVHLKNQGYLETPKSQGSVTLWPVYCLRGNGDVVVVYTDLESKRSFYTLMVDPAKEQIMEFNSIFILGEGC